jgi:hypothetical protein
VREIGGGSPAPPISSGRSPSARPPSPASSRARILEAPLPTGINKTNQTGLARLLLVLPGTVASTSRCSGPAVPLRPTTAALASQAGVAAAWRGQRLESRVGGGRRWGETGTGLKDRRGLAEKSSKLKSARSFAALSRSSQHLEKLAADLPPAACHICADAGPPSSSCLHPSTPPPTSTQHTHQR